jgi:glycosyltransferase involved in cell wall biosynthesis
MKRLSVVIPALNEEEGIGPVLNEIPIKQLKAMGYEVEVLVIDNGSTDNTKYIARNYGATVIVQPVRGYGNAYKAGFANASGDVIATGDADLTYPFSDLPKILKLMEKEDYEFINTDRLSTLKPDAMSKLHVFGNWVLTTITKVLFNSPFHDSQSGMWVFKRHVWDGLRVKSSGMPFSQELKMEALFKNFRCAEVPIDYRHRAGTVKLNAIKDAIGNVTHLFKKRLQISTQRLSTVRPSSVTPHKLTRVK